jgi:alginate O-acetyltransferase complex protein AlgI
MLGFFKYADFTLQSAAGIAHLLGADVNIPTLDIILPIGISFYTFHTISYIVDCYRGVIRPTRSLWEFSAYVSLFSQLVAGPIVRFRQIEADLEALGTADRTRWLALGTSFFMFGLIEKVVIADSLAHYVDEALVRYEGLSTAGAWSAMLGYTFQLYFDFSGYSSMAVGLGLMFGLRIPQNFNSPYKSLNPSDFWQRWHISLSSCLRDYLYIPLGGNRGGQWKTYRNLMITMLIGGLWHGANWTFVVWGAYHGALLIAYQANRVQWDRLPRFAAQGLMLFAALIGWVFFRSHTFSMATSLLGKMFTPTQGALSEDPTTFVILIVIAAALAMRGPNAFDFNREFKLTWWRGAAIASAFGVSLALIAGGRESPFLYFQF